VNISGPFSGIEQNGKTATLAISGNTIHINGTGTDSGTGSDRNSGISAGGGSRVNVTATDSSITGREEQSSTYLVPDVPLVQSLAALSADHTGNKPECW